MIGKCLFSYFFWYDLIHVFVSFIRINEIFHNVYIQELRLFKQFELDIP